MRRILLITTTQARRLLQEAPCRRFCTPASSTSTSRIPFVQRATPSTNTAPRSGARFVRNDPPARIYLNDLITEFTTNPSRLASHSWTDTLEHCKSIDRSITDSNFGAHVFQFCIRHQNLAVATSFFGWTTNPNLSVLSSYLFLIGRSTENSDVNLISRLYGEIKAKNRGIWDIVTAERVIPALCKTSAWRDSLNILESVKIGGSTGGITTYDAVISAAFDNGDSDLGWSLLDQFGHLKPSDTSFIAYLRTEGATLERLFDYMDFHEIYPTRKLINALQGGSQDATITNGACSRCKTRLEPNMLTRKEFDVLADEFLNRVLETNDVFMNTTPEELHRYKKFVDRTCQGHGFDVVLDGLNIAYRGQGGKPSVRLLKQTIDKFQGSQVLLIGRSHMRRWPGFQQAMDSTQRLQVYLINDNSEDDPFLIYAALRSGPSCRFVSNDQLRNHTFRLHDRGLARLFKRWRLSRQLYLDDRMNIRNFVNVLPVPQKVEAPPGGGGDPPPHTKTIWHIPFSEERLKSCYEVPEKWICFKTK